MDILDSDDPPMVWRSLEKPLARCNYIVVAGMMHQKQSKPSSVLNDMVGNKFNQCSRCSLFFPIPHSLAFQGWGDKSQKRPLLLAPVPSRVRETG